MKKTFYIKNGKICETRCRVTRKFVYTKNNVYPKYIGFTYKTKESAIRSMIADCKGYIESLKDQSLEINQKIQKNIKRLSKLQKQLPAKKKATK